MADNLSLLFRLKAENQASPAIKAAQADVAKLKTSFGSDLNQMQGVATSALGKITQSLTQVTGQIPIVGTAVSGLSSQFSTLASTTTTSAGSLGLIAGVSVVAATALGGLLKTLFDITVQSAEFQGKMFDMSQATGVSVETLSTLEIVAKTTGGNIDSISASLGIFQKKLEDAQDPTSKEAALLQRLGVDTRDTETAFRQTLAALARMPEGFRQTALALELFGRGGKAILAMLKEMDGDLDGTKEKFRQMGILITTEAAKAADQFNDKLALLGFQIRSVTGIIGNEAMPTILSALNSISTAFQENRGTILAWTRSIADAASGALVLANAVRAIGTQIIGLNNVPFPAILQALSAVSGVGAIFQGLRRFGTPEIPAQSVPDVTAPKIGLPALPGVPSVSKGKGGGGADKAAREAEQRTSRAIRATQQALEESTRRHREILERERERDLISIDNWEKESIRLAEQHEKSQQEIFNREEAAARKFIKNREDLALELTEIQRKRTKATDTLVKELDKVEFEAQKQRDQQRLDVERQVAEIRNTLREVELEKIEDALDRQAVTESEALSRRLALLTDAHKQRVLLIDIELALETTSAAKKGELDNQKTQSEIRYTAEKDRLTQQRIDAVLREQAATAPGATGISGEVDLSGIGENLEKQIGPPPVVSRWKSVLDGIKEQLVDFSSFTDNTIVQSIEGLAVALGHGIAAWALYGESLGTALRKGLAQVLASIAAEAAIQALLHAAYAIGRAAFGDFGGAAKHAIAALKFAAVAAAAGLGAKAVAGGAFQSGGSANNSTGTTSTSGATSSTPTKPQPVDIDRNRAGGSSLPINQTVVLKIQPPDGWFGQEFRKDYTLNGVTRLIIQTDGQS